MGSKGSQTTTTNQNQTYSANPAIAGAAGQAISGAQSAASQPFQMPVAPVAGFSGDQSQAFNQFRNLQGMAQPYYDTAAGYTAQSAAPITGADVNQYYNPMADNVTKQLQNIYGQQNVQNQGDLTQRAGGVGADRIAVGMGELANQQGLASGQIYSQLYQQALQAAQQQKQMAAGAGSAFANYGTGAQTAALQGTGALATAGNQQQQQNQAELNAPYQNELARIAYQFQTPQYLAGITGGLAPALGGTTTGQQQTTQPSPSWISQLLGLGTAGAGLAGSMGAFGGSASYGGGSAFGGDAYGGSSANPLAGLTASDYGAGFAEGGSVDDDQGPALPGSHVPKAGGVTPIPLVSLPAGAGHSGPLTGGINFPSPQSGHGDSGGGGLGEIANVASKILPFLLKRGGGIPYMDANGDVPIGRKLPKGYADGGDIDWGDLASGIPTPDNGPNFNDRYGAAFPHANRLAEHTEAVPLPAPRPSGADEVPYRLTNPEDLNAWRRSADVANKGKTVVEPEGDAGGTFATAADRRAPNPYMMPHDRTPYPDSLERDYGQQMTRSPWMGLIKAGATMAATPGPIGTVIGKGILAGTGALEGQRKELRTEQELNDKAQKLYQDAQVHLDKYTKMTPYEHASVQARNRELDQAEETGTAQEFKPAEIKDAIRSVNEKPENVGKPPQELQKLYAEELARRKALRAGGAGEVAGTGPLVGAQKEFDDGKGGKVIGVWDGSKWTPKQ